MLLALLISVSVCGCCSSKGISDTSVQQRQPTHLSSYAQILQNELRNLDHEVKPGDADLIKRYSLIRQNDGYYVAAILTLSHPYVEGELGAYGVKVQSVQGDMLTALIPINRYFELISSRVVKVIEISPKPKFSNIDNEKNIYFFNDSVGFRDAV